MNLIKAAVILLTIAYAVVADDSASTPASNTTDTTKPTGEREEQHQNREQRRKMRREQSRIMQKYENSFYKLAPNVYDQMMAAVQACDSQMKMNTETVQACASRRLNRQRVNKKKEDKNRMKDRSQRQVQESSDATTEATTGIPVIRDDEVTQTPVVTEPSAEQIKTWKQVIRYERTVVRCFVEEMRKSEFKGMPWKEWRDVRDQKAGQQMALKAECMHKQLFNN